MKDFKSIYYILNMPWKNKLKLENVKKFSNIKYGDKIIFHFDFNFSIFNTSSKNKEYNFSIVISCINVCLRYYQLISKLYPHNKIYIIIHMKENSLIKISYDAFKSITDLIPKVALCRDNDVKFDSEDYKHIFYGICQYLPEYYKYSNIQKWSVHSGTLVIT